MDGRSFRGSRNMVRILCYFFGKCSDFEIVFFMLVLHLEKYFKIFNSCNIMGSLMLFQNSDNKLLITYVIEIYGY